MNTALLATMALAGSLHCAGMCGPLALLAGRRFVLYATGKASTYVLLGAIAGTAGQAISAGIGGRALSVIGGVLLLVAGLHSVGLIGDRLVGTAWLARASRQMAMLAKEGPAGALLLGAANGVLPCPMTYAFVIMAAASGSPVTGAGTMLILGAVTAVPLGVCAFAGVQARRLQWRPARSRVVSGVLLIAAAALLVARGFAPAGTLPCCP